MHKKMKIFFKKWANPLDKIGVWNLGYKGGEKWGKREQRRVQ